MNSKRILIPRPSFDLNVDSKIIEEEEDQDDDFSEDLPSFKSVILNPAASLQSPTKPNLFYDQKQSKWVEVDNFAFNDNTNHFDEKSLSEETSSLALLDSKIFDESSSKLEEDSKIIVTELRKQIDDANESITTTEDSSQPNSLDVSFETKPKIKSPRDSATKPRKKSPSLRKLSNESQKLPSRPETSTPESSEKKRFKQHKAKCPKKDSQQSTAPGGVQRKLNLDKSARKLGQNRSHSATNLHKISVKDYHGSFQLQRTPSNAGS